MYEKKDECTDSQIPQQSTYSEEKQSLNHRDISMISEIATVWHTKKKRHTETSTKYFEG